MGINRASLHKLEMKRGEVQRPLARSAGSGPTRRRAERAALALGGSAAPGPVCPRVEPLLPSPLRRPPGLAVFYVPGKQLLKLVKVPYGQQDC